MRIRAVFMRGVSTKPAILVLLAITVAFNALVFLITSNIDGDQQNNSGRGNSDTRYLTSEEGHANDHSIRHRSSDLWMQFRPQFINVIARNRERKGFMTIGIPSIRRVNGMTYVNRTLASIIAHTSHEDQLQTVVVVFLADVDRAYNDRTSAALNALYSAHIASGFLHLVQVSAESYPPFDRLRHNFRDDSDRVQWRAKQVCDYAFLFVYAQNLSTYHLQLEDDVESAQGFVRAIKKFVRDSPPEWTLLEFSELGFIGKLVRSSDLLTLARYLMLFYHTQPVDFLLRFFRMSMAQEGGVRLRKPTLFQHFGLHSSLPDWKDNLLKDRFYGGVLRAKRWRADDPPGRVFSVMSAHSKATARHCYRSENGFFWVTSAHKGDTLTVVFEQEVLLRRVVVETGDVDRPDDLLDDGVLLIAPSRNTSSAKSNKLSTLLCGIFREVGHFQNGRVDVDHLHKMSGAQPSRCVRVLVTDLQTHWVLFEQIAVYSVNESPTMAS